MAVPPAGEEEGETHRPVAVVRPCMPDVVPEPERLIQPPPSGIQQPQEEPPNFRRVHGGWGRQRKQEGNTVLVEERRSPKWKRALYIAGWVFCCPVFSLCWALREKHVDEEDLREDECYPCWT